MKNFKILLSGITLVIGLSTNAMAQVPCSTLKECQELRESLKAQLKAVNAQILVWSPAPRIASTEINGVKWSNVLPGTYQNLDLDNTKPINGIIQKSQATEACKALGKGWFLPTKEDFEMLGSDFKKIPGMTNHWFWSSSVYPYVLSPFGAFSFYDNYGSVGDDAYRGTLFSVVCVERR
jgi:hypothetical protein